MKFFKELYIRLSKVQPLKKRKRSNNHEIAATEKARTKVVEERMEPTPPTSSILSTLIFASLFEIIETSPDAGEEMSDQPIEVGKNVKSEAKSSSYLVEEGEVDPIEEASLPL